MHYNQEQVLRSLAARSAIVELVAGQNRACETGDAAAWLATFTETARIQRPDGTAVSGPKALKQVFEELSRSNVHACVDQVVAVDGVAATHNARLLLGRGGAAGSGPSWEATGRYHDTLVYERGAWYMASRVVTLDAGSS